MERLSSIERFREESKLTPDKSPVGVKYAVNEETDLALTLGNSENKENDHKTILCSTQPQTFLVSAQANSPQPVPPAHSSPNSTFPPLPPKEPPNMEFSEVPPLPSEDTPNDIVMLAHKPPPPPPEISTCDEKVEHLSTSTSQVEDMDLSDGDDDCEGEVQTNPEIVEVEEHIGTHVNSEDATMGVPTQMPTSQLMTGNIVYNNHPHMYQNYYQNYHQQMFQGQSSTGLSNDINETTANPLNDALTSFYSDLASIDKTSDTDYDAGPRKPASYHCVTDSSSELSIANHDDTSGALPVPPVGLSEQEARFHSSNISNPSVLDDNSNSPRALTPDRSGQEEKEKRKKRAKLASGLSMKKKGVSNLVAKWQNIQEESSKQRPQ